MNNRRFLCGPNGLTRRHVVALAASAGIAPFANAKVKAEIINDLTYKIVHPQTIAIPDFLVDNSADEETARVTARVITENLRRSGQFALIDPASFEKIPNTDVPPRFADWRAINALMLVAGRISRQSDGRLKTEFRLWDVFAGAQLNGRQYFSTPDNFRRIAHIISDAIYEYLVSGTGDIYEQLTVEKGYFDSRVVFVDQTGPKERRVKRIALMDQDGANLRYLTGGEDLVGTPHFSPSSREIIYTSFSPGGPRVYLLKIETGQREIIGNFPGLTVSPRFSPDGQRIIMSLPQDGNFNLFVMDLRSKAMTRLTDTRAIDTAPCHSPDGNRICFESDRGGRPQIYVMAANGGPAEQISVGESYSTPVWSPRGNTIAFTWQNQGSFAIGTMRPNGHDERILINSYHNVSPTFAPNGRTLMFFRDPGGSAGPALFAIDLTGRNELWVPTPSFARDPDWSLLLPRS
jgi:TolB protein